MDMDELPVVVSDSGLEALLNSHSPSFQYDTQTPIANAISKKIKL